MDIDSSSTIQGNDNDELYFSDESSFYGDDEFKAACEERVNCFDPQHYWENVHPYSTQVLSAKSYADGPAPVKPKNDKAGGIAALDRKQLEEGRQARQKQKNGSGAEAFQLENVASTGPDLMELDIASSPPRNPFEGQAMAKQLDESLEGFLRRLQPSSTTIESGPWIWIANPFASNKRLYRNQPRLVEEGNGLLEVYISRKTKLEEQNPTLAAATITRRLKPEREWLETSLSDLAQTCSVTNGKWMLFPKPTEVDAVWAVVAKGTLDGRLGCEAKVATDAGDGKADRLICVYTEDFSDVNDVKRVLTEMGRLGLVSTEKGARWIYYKTDAYTYLDIKSDNAYKLKASMYCSKDLLPEIDERVM